MPLPEKCFRVILRCLNLAAPFRLYHDRIDGIGIGRLCHWSDHSPIGEAGVME